MQPAPQLAPYARFAIVDRPHAVVQYFEAGSRHKPTIILIHGLQDEADTWRHVFEPLAQTHHVVALDLPGFGRSDKTRRDYDVPFYVRFMLAFMNHLSISHATLIGNSLGAMIAETIALAHPARVNGLVLVDGTIRIVARPPSATTNPIRMVFAPLYDRRYFEGLRRSTQAAYDSLRPYYANLDAMPQADREFLFQRVNERVWDEEQRLASLAIQMSFPAFFILRARKLIARIPASPVPATVIWGAEDHIVPIRNGQERAALQPSARFACIEGAGHLPHQEKPSEFLAALAQTLL